MEYKKWEPKYREILKDFNFSIKNDEKSAQILDSLLQKKQDTSLLEKLIHGKNVVVFGAGSSLETSIIKHKEKINGTVKIAADGTTTALLENNIFPDVIITDLDGKIPDQIKANSNGAVVIIHAHGDNIDKIKKYVPKFKGIILGTTQTDPEPYDKIYNFGGFTDGDRAVFLADHFQAQKINLIGFDFNGEIGKYSFSENKDRNLKLKKLKWCKHLIEMLNKNGISVHSFE